LPFNLHILNTFASNFHLYRHVILTFIFVSNLQQEFWNFWNSAAMGINGYLIIKQYKCYRWWDISVSFVKEKVKIIMAYLPLNVADSF
jgi:hypothetical protein